MSFTCSNQVKVNILRYNRHQVPNSKICVSTQQKTELTFLPKQHPAVTEGLTKHQHLHFLTREQSLQEHLLQPLDALWTSDTCICTTNPWSTQLLLPSWIFIIKLTTIIWRFLGGCQYYWGSFWIFLEHMLRLVVPPVHKTNSTTEPLPPSPSLPSQACGPPNFSLLSSDGICPASFLLFLLYWHRLHFPFLHKHILRSTEIRTWRFSRS